jgi:CBS domain-containing protein
MGTVPPLLCPGTSLPEAADALRQAPGGELPVADADGRLLGVLAAEALAERMGEPTGDEQAAGEPARWAEIRPTVPPDLSVADALELLDRHSVHALPVVEDDRLVGWLTPAAVLDHIRRGYGAG